MSNLLEETRKLMPGRARSNWSLTEQAASAGAEKAQEQVEAKKVDIAAVEAEWDSLLDKKYPEAIQAGDIPAAKKIIKALEKIQKTVMVHDPKRQGMRSYVNTVFLRARQVDRLEQEKKTKGEGLEVDEAKGEPVSWETLPRPGSLGTEYVARTTMGGKPVKLSVFPARPAPTDEFFWVAYVGEPGKGQGLDGSATGVAKAKAKAESAAKKLIGKAASESVAGAPGPFVISDEGSVRDEVEDLLDRVRSPRWEYPSWALPKVRMDEDEGKFKAIEQTIDGVEVRGEVFSDGSGMSLNLSVPMAGSVFRLGVSVGDVSNVKIHPISNMLKVKRGVRDAVFKKAEQVVGKLVKDQSPDWLKANQEMYEEEDLSEAVDAGMPKRLLVLTGNKKLGIPKGVTFQVDSVEPFESGAKLSLMGLNGAMSGKKLLLWARYLKHVRENDQFNLSRGDGINKVVVKVTKRAESE